MDFCPTLSPSADHSLGRIPPPESRRRNIAAAGCPQDLRRIPSLLLTFLSHCCNPYDAIPFTLFSSWVSQFQTLP